MYVTGGFGSDPEVSKHNMWTGHSRLISQIEGFHEQPHYLPQSTEEGGCYAETCASISAMMVAERLLSFGIDAEYRETMETCLYNNVLGGTSLDAQSFYYWNKLASSGLESCTRDRWYEGSSRNSRPSLSSMLITQSAAVLQICLVLSVCSEAISGPFSMTATTTFSTFTYTHPPRVQLRWRMGNVRSCKCRRNCLGSPESRSVSPCRLTLLSA